MMQVLPSGWMIRFLAIFVLVGLTGSDFLALPQAVAGDWPQILGPNRSGKALNEELAENWSAEKPAERWTADVGQGYAGPAVVGDRVYLFHRRDRRNQLDCYAARSGDVVWSLDWAANYRGGIDPDLGPRCVPVVSGGRIFLFSAGGDVHCATTAGEKVWSRRLGKETKAQDGYFGFGSTPIVVGNRLLVNVGGSGDQSIVALNVDDGKTQWSKFRDAASYSMPVQRSRAAGSTVIFVTRLNLLEINPANGDVLFSQKFGAIGPTVNAAAPVLLDNDRLFVTASYRVGAKCFALSDDGDPKTLWQSDDVLSSQYPTPVYYKGHLFGVHGREDGAPASLRCVNVANGKVAWRKNGVGMAHLIVADDKLLMLTTQGELVLLEPSTEAYRELGRLQVSSATTRALPALSNGRLFLRDTDGVLACWDIP